MNLCDKCRQENEKVLKVCECDYEEIHMFFNYINENLGQQFELYDCPDK